ncbi:amidase signature domain-containing protein [Xylaria bambusicola]|uniref:amidase signature domain-containing protein n=1 Tax=Xylaria bambusicola TaxID=326684 RepID=UPI002007732B|nr:amidase signature domain-containing protein [Xylaria bambusicola]KAI0508689.1 amidase signature domain-containing protein [Xylaria bambusicola]
MPATITTASGATWEEVAADRQRHRDISLASFKPSPLNLPTGSIPVDTSAIPRSVLAAQDVEITEKNVEDLVPMLASGQWSAKTVVQAFMRRAALAQQLANCVTELLPEQALKRAAELDDHLAATGKPIGPLHGVPISVKEHIMMKGLDSNAGFVGWVGRVAEEDAHILQILWAAGAVFYVRTTQPQTLMHLETSNNLYGATVNPYNTTLTAGGSSGGEGALVGLRGSVLGIGTDIGGSIRSPAANNGVFGFKPTALRLPVGGWALTMAGADHILPTIGPLCTSLEGVLLFVRTILHASPWLKEPSLIPIPWKDEVKPRAGNGAKLRVGVIWDDGVVRPHPPVAAALSQVVEKLRGSDEIEVVDWQCYKHDLAWEIIAKLYFCDGGAEEKAAVNASGEPFRPLSKWILEENPHVREHTIPTLWKAHQERDAYRASYAALWNEQGVDVILCPVGPGVAPKLDTSRYWGYTAQWNLLNYPAIVFPTGAKVGRDTPGVRVGAEDLGTHEYPADYKPLSEADAYNYGLWKDNGVQGYDGAPVSLQLVGRMYEDEKLLRALDVLLDAAGLAKTC